MKRSWIASAAIVAFPAVAAATMGSVISSWNFSTYAQPFANGVYVNQTYVFGIFDGTSRDYLYRFNKSGSFMTSFQLNGTSSPRGGDACHLGSGYLSLVDSASSYCFLFRTNGGNAVASFPVTVPGTGTLQNIVWTGQYYEVNDYAGRGSFHRYNTAGSFIGRVNYGGWPAAMTTVGGVASARVINGVAGAYLIASSRTANEPSCVLDVSGPGSLVATFAMPLYFAAGGCVGRSSLPSAYGDSYWVNWIGSTNMICYQIDVGGLGATSAVAPASLGRIKTVFR